MIGKFGFPNSPKYDDLYRADTSRKKAELIETLRLSEKLWNTEGKQQESNPNYHHRLAPAQKSHLYHQVHHRQRVNPGGQANLHREVKRAQRQIHLQTGRKVIHMYVFFIIRH